MKIVLLQSATVVRLNAVGEKLLTGLRSLKLHHLSYRITRHLNLPKMRSTYYRTDTVRFMGQRVRARLPTEFKTSSFLIVF